MATRPFKDPVTGEIITACVVEIEEEDNRPVILKLEDGSTLRIKLDVPQVVRLPGNQPTGEPHYFVQNSIVISVLDFATNLEFE